MEDRYRGDRAPVAPVPGTIQILPESTLPSPQDDRSPVFLAAALGDPLLPLFRAEAHGEGEDP